MAKVLLVAHWDWVLYNFQMPLARALKQHGHEVIFVCPYGNYVERLQNGGFRWVNWKVERRSVNPYREILSIICLGQIYRQENPHLVHHFTIKPNLYGSLAATLLKKGSGKASNLKTINTFTGLGFVFSDHPTAGCLRAFVLPLFRWSTQKSNCWTVTLNYEDARKLLLLRIANSSKISVIISSGVNTKVFCPNGHFHRQTSRPVVIMAARLLWDKGVRELVEAAEILKAKGIAAEFWLVGEPDRGNPTAVPEEWLKAQQARGVVRWLGYREDIPSLLQQSAIAVLPSYYEGVPKFLLEAAACGLPLVATDIEGCRVVVREGVNGFLVPPRNPIALADALERLLQDPSLRRRMGQASRHIAETEFDEWKVLAKWLALYDHILSSEN